MLTPSEIRSIENEIDRLIDEGLAKGTEVQVAGWMPGADWTGTVWDPIYQKACGRNVTAAGYCFGIFVWKAFMDRPDTWSFVGDAVKMDGTPIQSKVYFRIDDPRR